VVRAFRTDARKTLFDNFTQVAGATAKQQEGTGLGLAICREIVSRIIGPHRLRHVVGKGSTFYFELAKRRGRRRAGTIKQAQCGMRAGHRMTVNFRKPRAMTDLKTILHVDDDEDILEITRMALQLVDKFELHQCSSGRRVGASLTGMPDLLLLDVMMPG
jgi:CheY-like chemotaxis protein